MKEVLLLGCGEVGSAIKRLEEETKNNVSVIDPKVSPESDTAFVGRLFDVTHVCIPFSEKFVGAVTDCVKTHPTGLVIIHSTTTVGTTTKIKEALPGTPVVHSFVRGVHPKLYEGLKTFEKPIGGDKMHALKACEHLESIGMPPYWCGKAEASELGKILSTSYYGWCILFAKQAFKLCKKYDLDFDEVYKYPNEIYNVGYEKLGMNHVKRPVLYSPKGIIQGHCVTQNFELLPNSKLKRYCKNMNESEEL